MKLILILALCGIFEISTGAKILGVLHVPSRSHIIIGSSILHGLAEKGHSVTIATPFKSKDKIPNVEHIYLDGVETVYEEYRNLLANSSSVLHMLKFTNFTYSMVDATLRSNGMQNLMKSGVKFDAVIIEPFGNDALYGLGHVFNSHVIILSPGGTPMVDRLAGNVAPYSFVPNVMTTFSDKMSFIERVLNTFTNVIVNLAQYLIMIPDQKQLYEEFFKGAPDFDEAITNASLYLINSNIIFETPRPYLPNMIPVGGMHIKDPKKLPQDIQEYLDNAKDGAILFSLGSNVKSSDLPMEKREAVMKALEKLPLKVLWKFEEENLPGKPKNVKIGKWLPQSDILGHPNIKLFITHGGLLSSTEAVYRGVPILGIPFFADQHSNIATFVSAGYGQSLSIHDLTEETFTEKLNEVLNNPKYTENIKRDSSILIDQPIKPLNRAIFWVEHVIRHNGGKYLRSASLDLSLVQYLLLDVIAFTIFVIATFLTGCYLSLKTVCGFCRKRKTDKKQKRSKKSKRE